MIRTLPVYSTENSKRPMFGAPLNVGWEGRMVWPLFHKEVPKVSNLMSSRVCTKMETDIFIAKTIIIEPFTMAKNWDSRIDGYSNKNGIRRLPWLISRSPELFKHRIKF